MPNLFFRWFTISKAFWRGLFPVFCAFGCLEGASVFASAPSTPSTPQPMNLQLKASMQMQNQIQIQNQIQMQNYLQLLQKKDQILTGLSANHLEVIQLKSQIQKIKNDGSSSTSDQATRLDSLIIQKQDLIRKMKIQLAEVQDLIDRQDALVKTIPRPSQPFRQKTR